MTANEQYREAERGNLEYQNNGTDISPAFRARLMEGTTKADGRILRRIIKRQIPELHESLCLNSHNPHEGLCRKKPGLLVYVHSDVEYFLSY